MSDYGNLFLTSNFMNMPTMFRQPGSGLASDVLVDRASHCSKKSRVILKEAVKPWLTRLARQAGARVEILGFRRPPYESYRTMNGSRASKPQRRLFWRRR